MSAAHILILLLLSAAFAFYPSGEERPSEPIIVDYSDEDVYCFFEIGE